MTLVISCINAADHYDSVWRTAGRIPIPSTAGRVSFYSYASPLRSDRLFISVKNSLPPAQEILGNSVVFRARSAPARLWIIAEGEARLIFHAKGPNAGYSRLAVHGELIGLTETMAQLPFATTLTAVSRCLCFSVPRVELVRLLCADAALRAEILSAVAAGLALAKAR